MSGTLVTPPQATMGFDTSAALSASQAATLATAGYRFAIRCIGYAAVAVPEPLTAPEVQALQAAGLAVSVYQTFHTTGSLASAQGTSDGAYAASTVATLGGPPGMVIWYDLEGSSFPNTLYEYLNNWGEAVLGAGYLAGLYCGPQDALTWTQIMQLPAFAHYWLAGGYGVEWSQQQLDVPGRRFQMFQCAPWNQVVAGTAIDLDVTGVDSEGGAPVFWGAAT
jgi:hypothetical protein